MKASPPPRLHIIGRKNNGKTTLVVELVQRLSAKGLRVGTVKHTHHHHELDTPGKDSFKHREAGAAVVGILSPHLSAAFWPHDDRGSNQAPADQRSSQPPDTESRYELFSRLFHDCDLILVEGDTQTTGLKVEVWRAECGSAPIASDDASIALVVSNDRVDVACPTVPRTPPDKLITWILQQLA